MNSAHLIIVGSMPCLICGDACTQADVEAGNIIALTGETENYAMHVSHFFIARDGLWSQTADYEMNMQIAASEIVARESLERREDDATARRTANGQD